MTAQTKTVLKGYFNTGDIPTEAQFANLIDSVNASGATLTVAANDATQRSKDFADYLCDGTNDEVQIQAAIDALPAGGGRVLLSEGTFTVDQGGIFTFTDLATNIPYSILISTHGHVLLEGIPGATVIDFRAGAAVVNLAMVLVAGQRAAHRESMTQIQGIKFTGNEDVYECVMACYSEFVTVDHCWFSGGSWFSLDTRWISSKCIITNNYFVGKGGLVIQGDSFLIANNIFDAHDFMAGGRASCAILPDYDEKRAPGDYYTDYCSAITDNIFVGNGSQLILTSPVGCLISGNVFSFQTVGEYALLITSCPTVHLVGYDGGFDAIGNAVVSNTFTDCILGIQIIGADGTSGCKRNIIALNTMNPGPGDTQIVTGISEGGGTTSDNMIVFNHIVSATVAAIASTGTGTKVYGNMGYVTENQGAAAAIGDGGTIDHGCATTPTVAVVSGSVAGEIVTVTTLDATHITVAIKKHDGSAGTAQTVYWRAYV